MSGSAHHRKNRHRSNAVPVHRGRQLLGGLMLLLTLLMTAPVQIRAQEMTDSDSLPALPERKQVIKWNLGPMVWSLANINLSYERITAPHRSFSVNAGYFVLPSFGSFDSIDIDKSSSKWGFALAADRRYYFKKRNPGYAPDGLYWGIYSSLHYYTFTSTFSVNSPGTADGSMGLTGKIGTLTAGVELGYQFVLKNNITIDLIFVGPGISGYTSDLSIDGNLTVNEESEYIKALYDVLVSRFPGADKLIKEKNIKENGASLNMGPGFRYVIQIGYRF